MSEISYKEYVISACSITNEECEGGCDNCDTAKSRLIKDEEEENPQYIIDKCYSLSGRDFLSNSRYTVGKAELSDLEFLKKALKMPAELIEKKYLSKEFMEDHYPEWIKTTRILGITEQPEKMIYAKDFCMILVFSDCLYMVAPKLTEES